VTLEKRAKALLEALFDRYGSPDFYPTFTATWVEEVDGRKYFRVTGTHTHSGGELRDYDRTHSRDEILQLTREGYIELNLAITDKGKDEVDSNIERT